MIRQSIIFTTMMTAAYERLLQVHIQDPICFEEDLRVTIQQIGVGHRGLFERQDDVASVAYWYQAEPHNPFPALMKKEERWPR